jgi:membrane associated rhomboid family serine protease
MLLLPIGTDNPLRRTPVMNYALVISNFVIFIYFSYFAGAGSSPASAHGPADPYMLYPGYPRLYQFITYAFLHANWAHVIGNMLFLYIFGNSVNDKLGHLGYLLFYLAGGIASALGYALMNLDSTTPMLGASGAVAAVTGAYMVLFPKTYIHVFYWLFFIGTLEVHAFYFILFKLIIWDNVLQDTFGPATNVAYKAHIAGYIFGIGIPLAMLALKLLAHSPYDLWAVIRQRHRRNQYRRSVSGGYDPFSVTSAGRKKVDAQDIELDPRQEEIFNLRAEIFSAVNSSDLNTAVDTYLRLITIDPKQVLPDQHQLDVANKLMHLGKHTEAAGAYEAFLKQYPRYPFIEQIQLMLGLIYSRYLHQKEPARHYLQAALEKITDTNQKQMCQNELERLN